LTAANECNLVTCHEMNSPEIKSELMHETERATAKFWQFCPAEWPETLACLVARIGSLRKGTRAKQTKLLRFMNSLISFLP